MAYDIGPKIGIDGEAEFRKQLTNINNSLKTLKTEMERVSSEFRENAQSQDALTAKNRVLTKTIDEQKRKIEETKKALAFATGEYGESANETLRWQAVLNKAEATLNNLTSELRQNEQALDEMEKGLRDAATGARTMDSAVNSIDAGNLERLSTAAKGLGDKLSGVSRAAQGLSAGIAALVPATQELRRDMSFLEQNAKIAGVGMNSAEKAFKTFNTVSGETDSSVEAVSNLLQAGFTESNLQKAVEGLAGAATRFPDTLRIEGLADGLQETLATGKSVGPFAELLDRLGIGAENFDKQLAKCNTTAEQHNLILETLAKAGMMDTYEGWRKSNKELAEYEETMFEMKQALSDLAEAVAPIITKVAKIGTDLLEKFNALPDPIKTVAGILVLLTAAAAPAMNAVGTLGTSFGGLGKALGAIGPKLAALGGAISAAAAPIAIAVAAIGVLAAAIITLWKTNENFRTRMTELWEEIKTIFSGVFEQLKGIFSSFVEIVNIIWNNWGDEIMAVVDAVINHIVPIISNAMSTIQGVLDTVSAILRGDWKGAWNSAKSTVSSAGEFIKAKTSATFGVLASIIRSVGGAIGGAIQGAFQSGINFITALPGRAVQWGRDFVQGLINGITQRLSGLISTVSRMASTIRSYLHFSRPDVGPLREYEKWMPDFVDGLAKGIRNNIPKIESSAKMLASTLAIDPVASIVQTAETTINSSFDYEKLASLMSQGIYIEKRQIGRAIRETGVITF